MDDFEAPTFSLGLDFESQRPSFSLGFEEEVELEIPPRTSSKHQPSDIIHIQESQESSDNEPRRPESNWRPSAFKDLDEEILHCSEEEPLPRLKRLKRGPPANDDHTPATKIYGAFQSPRLDLERKPIDCDDIEDFSNDDELITDNDKTLKTPGVRTSSSAKLSLSGRNVITTQLSQTLNNTPSVAGIRSSSIGSSGKKQTSKERFHPLSKICQLTDNFSDGEDYIMFGTSSAAWDTTARKGTSNVAANSSFGSQKVVDGAESFERKASSHDLQKQFNLVQNPNLPSPAFDEFCDEYFSSRQTTNDVVLSEQHDSVLDNSVLDSSVPTAYQYFDNEDLRIQRLLRQRLCHFLPISAVMGGEGQGAEQVEIDYLGQFGGSRDENGSSRVNLQGQVSNLTRKKSTSRSSAKKNTSTQHGNGTTNWTTTRNRTCESSVPRDAGKRRVSASGHYWYTDQRGRKIYVTKDGQEMTGSAAYMTYKKNSGKKSQKSKKKFKKPAAKKK